MSADSKGLLLLGLLLLGAGTPSQIDFGAIEIIHQGCRHGEEQWDGSDGRWDALYLTGDGFELVSRTVRVKPCHDAVLDDNPTEMTGRAVVLEEDGVLTPKPLFLVQGIGHVGSRPVEIITAYPEMGARVLSWRFPYPSRYLRPGEQLKLSLGKSAYILSAEGRHDPNRPYNDPLVLDYRMTLEAPDGRAQRLPGPARFILDGCPELVWAGDLDRDGKLDLYMNMTDHYNVTNYVLFLSSRADRTELVKQVASRRYTGC